jgi:hypothetical protein
VFYILLALFPVLAALVSLYGLFTDPTLINTYLSLLEGILPESTIGIIRDQVTRLSETSSGALSIGLLVSIAFALWSANASTKALIDAFNIVYHEKENRSFVRLTLVAFALTIGGIVFFILALSAVVILPLILSWLGLESWTAFALLRWPALLVALALWLSVFISLCPQSAGTTLAMGERRQHYRRSWLDYRLGALLLVSLQLRELSGNLWFARCRDRSHDVAVAGRYRNPDRRRVKRRD